MERVWMEKIDALEIAVKKLLNNEIDAARLVIQTEYPFKMLEASKRSYTDKQKMEQFKKDGFIDRYSGQKLVNPGILKVLSYYLPEDFPYHPHWKMESCHNAYWEFIPTVDHIYPVALGGVDAEENWATTSMLHNSIKSNWTLEQLQWKLYDAGSYKDWDGLTNLFVELVNANEELLKDSYIKRWYKIAREIV
jgi:hypothetical protein